MVFGSSCCLEERLNLRNLIVRMSSFFGQGMADFKNRKAILMKHLKISSRSRE